MRACFDEGIFQAYVDGELATDEAERVASHAAACATCAAALELAENELSLLSTAFEPLMNLPVPSEHLRARMEAAIGELRSPANAPAAVSSRKFKGWLSSLVPSFSFEPRRVVGFASLLAVIAFAALFALSTLRPREGQPLSAMVSGPLEKDLQPQIQSGPNDKVTPAIDEETPAITGTKVEQAGYRQPVSRQPRRASFSTRTPRANVGTNAQTQVAEIKPLPGEESYLKSIASLSSVIRINGENALKPSLRADYERNLALVNQAIDATRPTARRNPKDADAAEFLYASYQSKIELLSTVAEQGQMLAIAR